MKVADPEKQKRLDQIIAYESTNFQWAKLIFIWSLVLILFFINMMRGKSNPESSWLKLKTCDALDWGLFAILQVICIIYELIAVRIVSNEATEKEEVGYEFTEGDLRLSPSKLAIIVAISWFGSLMAAFAGIGAGSIFVPALTIIEMEPRVAAATGMYVTIYLTLASSISVIILGRLSLDYAPYVVIFTMLGSLPGLFFQNYMVQ